MSRHSEVQQGQKWLTNAAFDVLRKSVTSQAERDAAMAQIGGVVAATVTLKYSDDSGAGAAGTYAAGITVPAGAFLLDIIIIQKALWNAGTSAAMIVGDDDDPNGYFDAVNMKATDLLVGECLSVFDDGAWGGVDGAYLTTAGRRGPTGGNYNNLMVTSKTITASITCAGTAATTGETDLTVVWCYPKNIGGATFTAA